MKPFKIAIIMMYLGLMALVGAISYDKVFVRNIDLNFVELLNLAWGVTLIQCIALLLCAYLFQLGKSLFWYYKGYKLTAITLFPVLIQINPTFKLRLSYSPFLIFTSFLPYDSINRIENENDLFILRKDFLTSERVGLVMQMAGCVLLILIEVIIGKYLLLPHASFLLLAMYFLNWSEGDYYHGALSNLRNTQEGSMIYYLAHHAIYMEGDRKYIYDLFQQQVVKTKIPKKYSLMAIEALKHLYMEKCFQNTLPIKKEVYQNMMVDFRGLQHILPTQAVSVETYELLKVVICHSIITKDKKQMEDVKDCLFQILEGWSGFKSLENRIGWYLHLARHQRIREDSSKLFKNEVIRRNWDYNKLDRYRMIEQRIIQTVRNICKE